MNGETPKPTPPPPRKRLGWLRREGIDLGDAAVQFVAVVVGIVLGLFISQWSTHRQQQATVHKAMRAIRAELVANRAALRENAERWYKTAKRQMDSPKNRDLPPRICYRWDGWSGVGAALLTDSAYQTAIATQALAHMSFKQAHLVATIYSHQHRYREVFRFIQKNLQFSGAQSLDFCVALDEGLGTQHDRALARSYTPLIGPFKTKWPTPPPNPLKPTDTGN